MNKILLGFLTLFPVLGVAQSLTYPLPVDARGNPLMLGVGNPYSTTLTPTTSSYSASIQYQAPLTGIDTNRVYREIYIYNPSSTRTVYICFGSATACSTDNITVPPSTQMVLDAIRFGNAVGFPYVWARLDSAGSSAAVITIW